MTMYHNGRSLALFNRILTIFALVMTGVVLSGCNIPLLFWEEEGRKIVDDIVDEEEKLSPQDVLARG